jgi:hypothetical protein
MGQRLPRIVYWTCPKCGMPYWARKEPCSHRHAGRIICGECKEFLFEWDGLYRLVDWKPMRIEDIRPRGSREYSERQRPAN